MSLDEELNNIFIDTEKFLKQQRELDGDILYIPKTDPTSLAQSAPIAAEMTVVNTAANPLTIPYTTGEATLPAYPNETWTNTKTIDELNNAINTCVKCRLGKTRIKFVFGVGSPKAEVVVVGEAPGADEDEKGEPFVGRAGQLLNKILEAIHFKREEVFICNILK
jgi:DNA polymerase